VSIALGSRPAERKKNTLTVPTWLRLEHCPRIIAVQMIISINVGVVGDVFTTTEMDI